MTGEGSGLDAARTRIRRLAMENGWTVTTLAVAEDLADTARDDGTHALRSHVSAAERLGISQATVKRHRKQLASAGVIVERARGGRGRGASVVDLVTVPPEQASC
jgi:biotin operon repressor